MSKYIAEISDGLQDRIDSTDDPHKDPEILDALREETRGNKSWMAEELGVTRTTVSHWLARTGIEEPDFDPDNIDWESFDPWKKIEFSRKPHTDPKVLHDLYLRREYSTTEMQELLDASPSTIRHHLHLNDIPVRPPMAEQESTMYTNEGRNQFREEDGSAYLSRLTAYADHGDDIYDKHIHHDLGMPFADIPRFLTPLTPGDHVRLHEQGEYEYVDGFPVLRPDDADESDDHDDPDPDGSVTMDDGSEPGALTPA